MEKVILILAIVVISIIHSWWKKRNGQGDEDATPWPTAPPRRPPAVPPQNRPINAPQPMAANWEEELRRLLQGEEPARPAPPPVVVQAPPSIPRVASPPTPRPVIVAQSDPDMDKGLAVPSLEQSAQAFLRASQIEAKVAAHMQRVDQQVATHPKLNFKKDAPPEIRQAVALVRGRQSQRAAIIAGIILGPPKSMEG